MLSLEPLTYHRPQQPDPRQKGGTRWCQVSSKVYQMISNSARWHLMTCYKQHFWLNDSITCPATFWPSKSIKQLIQGHPSTGKKIDSFAVAQDSAAGSTQSVCVPTVTILALLLRTSGPGSFRPNQFKSIGNLRGPTPSMPPPKNEARHNKGREQEK